LLPLSGTAPPFSSHQILFWPVPNSTVARDAASPAVPPRLLLACSTYFSQPSRDRREGRKRERRVLGRRHLARGCRERR
jgi:hypothetical protein